MINYLRGKAVAIQQNPSGRVTLILEVNGIGYQMQILSRLARQISPEEENLQVFTHLQLREDQPLLYGFITASERDLFRQLIAISGIGAQSAIALLDTLGLEELIGAIVTQNIKTLSKAPGVGNKTAERIALELKSKLSQWREVAGVVSSTPGAFPQGELLQEVETTLLALGYTPEEINGAISAVSQDNQMRKNPQVEEWIRNCIAWLG